MEGKNRKMREVEEGSKSVKGWKRGRKSRRRRRPEGSNKEEEGKGGNKERK